jgi:hypothetical protein
MGLALSTIASYDPRYGIAVWVGCALIASFFSFFVKCKYLKSNYEISHLEDLKRLDIDDVKNSEYIEEDVIRKYSFDQQSMLFRNSNVIAS